MPIIPSMVVIIGTTSIQGASWLQYSTAKFLSLSFFFCYSCSTIHSATACHSLHLPFARLHLSNINSLRLNSQRLCTNNPPLRPRHNPILYPRLVPHDSINPHVIAPARLPHGLNHLPVLALHVPVCGVHDGDFRIVCVPVVDELGELLYFESVIVSRFPVFFVS